MIKEVKILMPEGEKQKKGDFFEGIIGDLMSDLHYKTKGNYQFTGSEIDLICEHDLNKGEKVYIECKAKEKLESKEINAFLGKLILAEDVKKGIFISTITYQKQAGALIEELKNKDLNKELYFWGPEEIIKSYYRFKSVSSENLSLKKVTLDITKEILIFSEKGVFISYLLKTKGTVSSSSFILFNIDSKEYTTDKNIIDFLTNKIEDLNGLENISFNFNDGNGENVIIEEPTSADSVIEVSKSDHWYDLSPSSFDHFIGRTKEYKDIISFFKSVKSSKTDRRIFRIQAKSGIGKSSFVNYLDGKILNTKTLGKDFFLISYDTRSAISGKYMALSLEKAIKKAMEKGFIKHSDFSFSSHNDLISSEYIKPILKELKEKNKVLILIFDQFEDIFRKEGIFKPFYKFLTDLIGTGENIIVGFSWKTEIVISPENSSYYDFQSINDYTKTINIPIFKVSEAEKIIKQLEKEIKEELNLDIKRRLIEGSQGYPWLIKKLCKHVLNEKTNGVSIEKLLEKELNIESLFNNDLERLSKEEVILLKLVAKESYENGVCSWDKIDDSDKSFISLLDKRLIIKSGNNYNIYWDIFRDFLVNGTTPYLGETYLIRQSVNNCYSIYELFQGVTELGVDEIGSYKDIGKGAIENTLRDLLSLGILEKLDNDKYKVTEKFKPIKKSIFISQINEKFQRYTPYLRIKSLNGLTMQIISDELQKLFLFYNFNEKTWLSYSRILSSWLSFTGIELDIDRTYIRGKRKLTGNEKANYMIGTLPITLKNYLFKVSKGDFEANTNYEINFVSDAYVLGLIEKSDNNIILTDKGKDVNEDFNKNLLPLLNDFSLLNGIGENIITNKIKSSKDLLEFYPGIFKNYTENTKKQFSSFYYSWGKYIANVKKGINPFDEKVKNILYNPFKLLKDFYLIKSGTIKKDQNFKRNISDLVKIGLLEDNSGKISEKITKISEKESNIINILLKEGLKYEIIKEVYNSYKNNKGIIKDTKSLSEYLVSIDDKYSNYKEHIFFKLWAWVRFIGENSNDE